MSEKIVIQIDLSGGDSSEFKSYLESITSREGARAGKNFSESFNKNVSSALGSFKRELIGLTSGFIALNSLKNAFIDSAKSAARFETAINEINSILPDNVRLTEEQEKSLIRLSRQFGTSASNQAKSFYEIISSGVEDTAKANELLVAANKLAIGGVADVRGAIDVLTSIVNAYGQENITAAEAADSLFTAVKLGKSTVDQLSASLAMAVPSARAAGVNLDTLNAAVSLLTVNGFATSEAVTRVNALLTALARNGDKLGATMSISAVKTDGFITVLRRLIQSTGGSSEKLLELLGRQEAVQAAQTLAKNDANDLANAYAQFSTKAGAAGKAFDIIRQSSEFRLNQLVSDIESLAIAFGNKLLPALNSATSSLRSFFGLTRGEGGEVTELNKKISELRQNLNKMIDVRNQMAEGVSVFGVEIIGADQEKIAAQNKAIEETSLKLKDLISQRAALLDQQKQEINIVPQITEQASAALEQDSKILTALDIFTESTQAKFEKLAVMFKFTGKQVAAVSKEIAAITFNVLSKGVGNAFNAVGRALANGQNAFEAFGQAIKGILADVASAIGDTFIKWGIANVVSGNVGMGSAQIAAGAALKVLSGFLGAQASGGNASPSSASTQATSVLFDDTNVMDFQEQERQAPSTNVEVVVQGSLVRQEELGQFITETLNESFAKQGVTLTDARVFA